MDTVVVRRFDKPSKVMMTAEASVINRSTTPPKVQFVPSHVNIWAPQAQQMLHDQRASKAARPQSAHGMIRKGLPITAVSLQSLTNVKHQARFSSALSRPSSAPDRSPVLTFSRADEANTSSALLREAYGTKMRSHPIVDPVIHSAVIDDAVKALSTAPATMALSGSGDNQQSLNILPDPQRARIKMQRPITPDFRKLHLGSVAQHSVKRPMSCQNPPTNPDFARRLVGETTQQKHTEIETFDSGGDSDTETFAHTRLTTASSETSRPSSFSAKHRQQSESRRPNFGMPASASNDADQRKSEIVERFSKTFVKVEDFAAFAGKTRFRSTGVKLEAALLQRLQSITQPNARAVIFAELFEDVISKDVAYGSVLRHIKNEYDSMITPTDPSELAKKYHQLMSTHRVATADLELARQEVMQLQELLSATRAEVQMRGSSIQILEENLAARRRRDVALTIADDEGQTVMESMRRQVDYLTLENERLLKELKETHSSADAKLGTHRSADEDGDGMERAVQLSTLTLDAQRSSSASSKISRKAQETHGLLVKAGMPSVQAAPLLQFTPGVVQHAPDKYSNDFDFSLKLQQQQPPVPPPLPIYNGELLQTTQTASLQKQSSLKNLSQANSSAEILSHTSKAQSSQVSAVRASKSEPSVNAAAAAVEASRPSAPQPTSAASSAVPVIPVNIVKAALTARPQSAGDRASDRSQNSEGSSFSASEANEGYDEVAELSRGVNMRRVARPDFVPTLTVVANKEATANDDDSSTERSYSYLNVDGEQFALELSPVSQNFL